MNIYLPKLFEKKFEVGLHVKTFIATKIRLAESYKVLIVVFDHEKENLGETKLMSILRLCSKTDYPISNDANIFLNNILEKKEETKRKDLI